MKNVRLNKNPKKIDLILVFLIFFLPLSPIFGSITSDPDLKLKWSRIYDRLGEQNPRGGALLHTTDGGFLIGSTTILSNGAREYWLLKTDAEGIEQWNKTYKYYKTSEFEMIWLTNIIQLSDNGFALIGVTETNTDWDVWLLKIDENGIEEWNKTYDGPENNRDYASAVRTTPDGGFIIGAFTRDPNTSGTNYLFDYWLIKTDANGNEEWNQTFDGLGNDESFPFIQTQDGNFLFGGASAPTNAGKYSIWVIKVNVSGNILWQKYYNNTESLVIMEKALIETDDGGFLLGGYTATSDWWSEGVDFHIIKTDSLGEIEWTEEYDGNFYDIAQVTLESSIGNYYVGGASRSSNSNDYLNDDMSLVKLSSNGEVLWNIRYGEPSKGDCIFDMVEVESQSNETLVILGYTESFGAETGDLWLGKFETKTTPTNGVYYSGYITFLTSLLVILVIHRRKRL